MGKTTKPLTIAVSQHLMSLTPVQELREKGHRLLSITESEGREIEEADIILSPKAWRMSAHDTTYINLSIEAARLVVYPKKGKG